MSLDRRVLDVVSPERTFTGTGAHSFVTTASRFSEQLDLSGAEETRSLEARRREPRTHSFQHQDALHTSHHFALRSGVVCYCLIRCLSLPSVPLIRNSHIAYDPQVIVDLILKGVSANRPKTRYAAGRYAKAMMLMRKWFFDKGRSDNVGMLGRALL
jgi:hypothetical protein